MEKKVQELRRINIAIKNNIHDQETVESKLKGDEVILFSPKFAQDQAVNLLADVNKYMNDLKKIESAYKKEIVNKGKEVKKIIEREENLLGNVYVRIEEYKK